MLVLWEFDVEPLAITFPVASEFEDDDRAARGRHHRGWRSRLEEKPMKRVIPLRALTPSTITPVGLMSVAPPALFGQEAIDRAIARAGATLADGHGGVVLHLDTGGEFSLSVIHRMGDHITAEGAVLMDVSEGWKFDKEHLRAQGEIVVRW